MELIEREATLEICEKEYQERLRMLDYCGDTVAWNIGGAIKALPTIDAAPVVHGRWKYYHKKNKAVCTNCSFERDLDTNFGKAVSCPNCGARMDGGDGHEAD